MRFVPTPIAGAFLIELEPIEDERGFFARTFCRKEFLAHGLNPGLAQCSVSFNRRKGTVRGMHYQAKPHQEAKLVRCINGGIFDVMIDLRPESPNYRSWFGIELTATQRLSLYIPEGVAHGFQTITNDAEVFYQISADYHPESAYGIRWDDPAFQVAWPLAVQVISERDRSYSLWTESND